ncbi:MAG: FG-GAP-like repeat-containing protein [candidate division KSB1 bacterium]|nr:FG-GAP-like repeat-containing protein [candidate division KSB1 bacterium]
MNTGRADVSISGRHPGDRFGQALFATDVNGDGVDDLIIGAPGTTADVRANAGAVYVLFGRAEWPSHLPMDSTESDILFWGREPEEQLGNAVASGDINADGRADLILAAWMGSYPGMIANGKVYVFWTVDSLSGLMDLLETPADLTVFGKNNNDFAGVSIAAADFDGDGHDDILIGDHKANTPAGLDAGVAYAVKGAVRMADTLWFRERPPSLLIMGPSQFDHFGFAMIAADLNGDGLRDWLVGARQANPVAGIENGGSVYAFFGHDAFPDTLDLSQNAADIHFYGTDAFGFLGSALAAGDVNGDGLADVVLAAPRATVNARRDAGRVYVLIAGENWPAEWQVNEQTARLTLQISAEAAFFGAALGIGDINGDGLDDLVVGAPGEDQTGIARVLFGSRVLQIANSDRRAVLPQQFRIIGLNPNPFQQTTLLHIELLQPTAQLRLRVFDLLGREVFSKRLSHQPPGMLRVRLNFAAEPLSALPAGIYWLMVETPSQRQVKRLVYLR